MRSLLKASVWLRNSVAAVLATTALASAPAFAKYPDHPISVIIPFPAGSGTDAVGRIFAQQLGEILGGPVVVENKPGGNATIGANYVARAKPDGYTLFITTNTSHSAAPFLNKNVPYDPVKDFTPIARGGNLPFILVVNPKLPIKSVQDLVAYAKKNPGKLTYASGNSTGIVAGATFADRAGIKILHVPYKGTPQAMTDVMSGQVDMMFTDVASSLAFVQSSKLRALAVSTAARSNVVPDIASMQDAGIQNFDINSWNGLLGPAGMPKDVVQQLNAAMNKIVNDPATRKRFADLGFDAFSGTPEDFAAFVSQQRDLWGKMIQDAGIAPE